MATTYHLAQIVAHLAAHGIDVHNAADLLPHEERTVTHIASLGRADAQAISFLADIRYQAQLKNTQAGLVLLNAEQAQNCPANSLPLVVDNPYRAYAVTTQLFAYQPCPPDWQNAKQHLADRPPQIHPTAVVADSAILGQGVQVGAFCHIGEHVQIGAGTVLAAHCVIEAGAILGQNGQLQAHCFIGHHCVLGDGVMLHSHASVGNEGFGFAPTARPDTNGWQKIHQLGRVVIGNRVRIGSQTCIDRGALDDTVIEDHVIIDNLVQIAHNVQIGAGTAIAACVGIAGGTRIGRRCLLGGGVGVNGHITITDDVMILGMSRITKSISQAGEYGSGTPMMPAAQWRRAAVRFKQLANAEKPI